MAAPRTLGWVLLACLAAGAAAAEPAAANGRAVDTFYARHGSTLLWSRSGSPTAQARALIATLQSVPDYGLSAADYGGARLAARLDALSADRDASVADWSLFDRDLTSAVLALVGNLHFGRVDPHAAGFDMPPRAQGFDPAAIVEQLAVRNDTAALLAAAEPGYQHYRLLHQSLARYRALAAAPDLPALPPLPGWSVKPGDSYAGAPQLRRRLAAVGDLPPQQAARTDALLDDELVAAIKSFQHRHGLAPDGALGAGTLAALRVPFAQRARQIELTLERWRWVPPLEPPTLIVNIPAFRLFLIRSAVDDEASMLRMNVIVGRQYPQLHTPVFAADMTAVLFRPYWDVPRNIVRRELLAELRRNPRYLETHDMELIAAGSSAAAPLAATADNLEALALGRLRLRQRPGPENALGLIKFVVPNRYDVYLHSTPAQRLFAEPRRAFSHGCIRVSDPVALAAAVMGGTAGDWTAEKIRAAMDGAATFQVKLARPVHVLILYGTAVAAEDGTVHFFDDIYGQDRRLEALLGLKPVGTRPPDHQ